ncbi:MAG: glycosyltransferase [Bacteroidetes bacterium]|nr:glycosyltransferase [Bacteroidota bacterium]
MNPSKNLYDFSVLHVATALSWRGGEQQVAYLVEELEKHKVRQYVLCSTGSEMEKYCISRSIPFFAFHKRSSFDLIYAKKIKDLCESNSIQLVHTHDSHAHTFAVVAALFGNKAKIIVSRRVDFQVSSGPFSKYKYNHPLIGRILCVSEKIKQITSLAVDDNLKLVTVHSGIDIERFKGKTDQGILHKEYNLPTQTKIVATIAALAPHKDFTTFVNTVEILSDKLENTLFFIIGEGAEREKIEKSIVQKSLQHKIILTGFRNDVADILPEVDLLLITSETEGLGTSILDAFACSVPVVATAAGGIPEIVIHQQTGLLADVRDGAGLAQNVLEVMNNQVLRNKLVAGALLHLNEFTKEYTATKTLREYHAVIGSAL